MPLDQYIPPYDKINYLNVYWVYDRVHYASRSELRRTLVEVPIRLTWSYDLLSPFFFSLSIEELFAYYSVRSSSPCKVQENTTVLSSFLCLVVVESGWK